MTPDELITPEEQREAARLIATEIGKRGLKILALGSLAVLLRSRVPAATSSLSKDVDVHPFPVSDFVEFHDVIEVATKALKGTMKYESDGASITLHIPVKGRDVPIEMITGGEFISPSVLADAVQRAIPRDGILIPSWEHLATMKAEAWFDRTGPEKDKYRLDLTKIRDLMDAESATLSRQEIRRLVEMREERKRREMLLTIERIFVRIMR